MEGKASKEQIGIWKKKYSGVYELSSGGAVCYIKVPGRKELSHATAVAANDVFKFNEVILNDCWLAGDESMREDDAKFLGVSEQLGEIIEKAEVKIKKL